MDVKRVIKLGGSYYVALPKEWVRANRLEGGYVIVEAEGGGVLRLRTLGSLGAEEKPRARVSCKGDVLRGVLSAYLKGYEVIEVSVEDSCRERALREISRAQSLLVGLELVEESDRELVLHCFIRDDYSVESLLSRMNAVSLTMLERAARALSTGDEALVKEVHVLDDRVDRLYFLAVRLIRSKVASPLTPPEYRVRLVDLRLAARNIEDLADTYEGLAALAPSIRCELVGVDLIAEAQRLIVKAIIEGGGRGEAGELLGRARLALAEAELPLPVKERMARVLDLLDDTADLV